jgi:hypothetical protein
MRPAFLRILVLLLPLQLLEGWLLSQPGVPPVQVIIDSQKLEFKFGDPIVIPVSVRNMTVGEQAKFEFMRFEVELSWPAEFTPSEEN